MWDGLFMLLSLSAVMAIASFLAGSLPLTFALSQRQLRFISALGTGVLVGTALIVIIPEGVETLYSAASGEHGHGHAARAIQRGLSRPEGSVRAILPDVAHAAPMPRWDSLNAPEGPSQTIPDFAASLLRRKDELSEDETDVEHPSEHGHDEAASTHSREPHAWIGVSLILGFILMYLIDVLPTNLNAPTPSYRPLHISLSNLSRGLHRASSPTPSSPPSVEEDTTRRPPTTTLGLIIHAVADGIALGASSTAPSTSLSLVIFLAIMLHKAPAAFGLTSVLLKQGISKRAARTHLAAFSLAAPVGALGTWVAVHLLGRSNLGGDEGMTWATGCMLLFSGGTFLYVAMHTLSESSTSHSHSADDTESNGFANPYSTQGHSHSKSNPSLAETAVMVVGMLVPLVTQVGHVH